MSDYATQNERVLRHITEHGSINQGETLDWSPPITRLAARIADLKAAGHPVDAIGKAGKFARYGIVAEPTPRVSPKRPACSTCGASLEALNPTLSEQVVIGYCLRHGRQAAFVR